MLFLISSSPDTKEFKSAMRMAKDVNAEICLLQNAVYASRDLYDPAMYVISDDIHLRGIKEKEISGRIINYDQLIDLMTEADKVAGMF